MLSGKAEWNSTHSPFSEVIPLAPGPQGEKNLPKKDVLITATLCNFWFGPYISSVPFAFSLPIFIMFNFAGTWL